MTPESSPQREGDGDLQLHAHRIPIRVAGGREAPLMNRIDRRLIQHRDRVRLPGRCPRPFLTHRRPPSTKHVPRFSARAPLGDTPARRRSKFPADARRHRRRPAHCCLHLIQWKAATRSATRSHREAPRHPATTRMTAHRAASLRAARECAREADSARLFGLKPAPRTSPESGSPTTVFERHRRKPL